jgi:hypothetical protein
MTSRDYLKALCDEYGITLMYTDNDYTILSTTTSSSNRPVLKVYSYFKGCPQYIAQTIIDYYTSEIADNKYADQIYDYLGEKIFFMGCIIDPPNDDFRRNLNPRETQ